MIKTCQRCGESYDALGRAKYCIVCRVEVKREQWRTAYHRYNERHRIKRREIARKSRRNYVDKHREQVRARHREYMCKRYRQKCIEFWKQPEAKQCGAK